MALFNVHETSILLVAALSYTQVQHIFKIKEYCTVRLALHHTHLGLISNFANVEEKKKGVCSHANNKLLTCFILCKM